MRYLELQKVILILGLGMGILFFDLNLALAGAPWTEVLQKGKFRIKTYHIQTWIEERFDNAGNKLPLSITPIFQPPVQGTITTDGKSTSHSEVLRVEFGITDRLSVGMLIPYDTCSLYGTNRWEGIPANFPSYSSFPNDPNKKTHGIGDIKLGAQYLFSNSPDLAFAILSAAKLPTGKVAHPDKPGEISIGTGQAYLQLSLLFDHTFSEKEIILSEEIRFNLQMEGRYDMKKEDRDKYNSGTGATYRKDPGDEIWLAIGLQKNNFLTPGLSPNLRFEARFHSSDDYSSFAEEFDRKKETDTASILYFIEPEIRYSLWKRFKIPGRIYANYRIPLKGKNTEVMKRLESGLEIIF